MAATTGARAALVAVTLALPAMGAAVPADGAAAPGSARPQISATSAAVVDARDGHVVYRQAARAQRAIASTTKLMTALLALERLPLDRRLTAAPYSPAPAESRIDLRPRERMAVVDLLRALLLESANDAAETLARGEAGSVRRFVRAMNQRARQLGLEDTHYANPIGLDEPGNHSSALDLSRLARRLLANDVFAAIVDSPSARLRTGARRRVVDNRNDLVGRVPWIDGVKTGHTIEAGYVLVGSGRKRGVHLVSVVLGEPSEAARDADTLALLDYGFSRYRRVRLTRAGKPVASARVKLFGGRRVGLVTRGPVRLTVRRGQSVRTEAEVPTELEGPIGRGQQVGELRVFRAGRLVRVVPLVTAGTVPDPGALRKLAGGAAWVVFAATLGLGGLALALRRRGAGKR